MLFSMLHEECSTFRTHNASSGTEVNRLNGHHSISIVVEEANELLQQPEAANTAL